ncbi:MAG: hypothetical protein PHE89_04185 [Alphaproteobacteria bacterium]|nr:hypothetical protein [Alphaproteobacteria bacterium]
MKQYAKITENGEIETPPTNKDNILNYNLDKKALKKDGYLELITQEPPNDGKKYRTMYEEKEGKIHQLFIEEIELYNELRAKEYPAIGDIVDAICKALDGDRSEFDELNSLRLSIKQKYSKPPETSEQSEVSSLVKEN